MRAGAWRSRLPFLIPLRHNKEVRSLEAFPRAAVSTIPNVPDGWVQEAFADDGTGVLLVFDGIDEVPAGPQRHDVLGQIEGYAKRFPMAQILVTARPNAVEADALDGFLRVELDDLDPDQKRCFIEHWHAALAANVRRQADDPIIRFLREAVRRELERQPALDRLAANPLLCAAVCALHWLQRRHQVNEGWARPEAFAGFEGNVLPGNIWSLCEKLVYMLAHQRDLDRRLQGGSFGPAYELSYELKREILARLAYGMVAGDLLSAMPRDEAVPQIDAAVAKSREPITVPPPKILDALIERSGVLRGSGEDSVEFVHNTLKAFLAAKFYLGLNVPKDLARRVATASAEELASGLDEVAVFAAASPDHPAYAKQLIERLIGRHAGRARQRQLLALRCEAAASSNLAAETRGKVRQMAPALFPPRDMAEARQLAALGNEAVRFLEPRANLKEAWAAACVRCLRLIGTTEARRMMERWRDSTAMSVVEELAQTFEPLTLPTVTEILSSLESWSLPETIRNLITDAGLPHLAALPGLHMLDLTGTQVTRSGVGRLQGQRAALGQSEVRVSFPAG